MALRSSVGDLYGAQPGDIFIAEIIIISILICFLTLAHSVAADLLFLGRYKYVGKEKKSFSIFSPSLNREKKICLPLLKVWGWDSKAPIFAVAVFCSFIKKNDNWSFRGQKKPHLSPFSPIRTLTHSRCARPAGIIHNQATKKRHLLIMHTKWEKMTLSENGTLLLLIILQSCSPAKVKAKDSFLWYPLSP